MGGPVHSAFVVILLVTVLSHGCVPPTPPTPKSSPPPRTPHGPTGVEDKEIDRFIKDVRAHKEDAPQPPRQQDSVVAKSVAVIWAPERTPLLQDVLLRFAVAGPLSQVTINTVLLELSDKQLKKSAQAASNSLTNDPLLGWIVSAQKMGFRVFLTTPFRFTTRYAEKTVTGGTTSAGEDADIFSPEVKKGILSFYRNIARYPLNGIYVNQIAYGMKEGITPYAVATYQDAFSEKLEARQNATSHSLWRFAGLKSRHITKVLNDIWAEIHMASPEMEFGIGIPEILLMDPAKGLLETSLDYLELKEAQFDFYVVASLGAGVQKVSESLLKYGKLERVWFHRTRKETIVSLLEMPIQGVIVTTP